MQRVFLPIALLALASAVSTAAAAGFTVEQSSSEAPSAAQAGDNKNDTKLSGDKQFYMTKGPDNGYQHRSASVRDYHDHEGQDRPYTDSYRRDEGPYGSPEHTQYEGGDIINLKFQERFNAPTESLECPGTFPLPEGRNCTDAEVDVVCNHFNSYYKGIPLTGKQQHKSPGLLLEDAPKSLAIGVMKTVSATSNAESWRQLKVGKQTGYEVGKIAGEITFDVGAGACDARLAGATATFTDVPVYAMITRASKPVSPSMVNNFVAYAKEFSQPPCGCFDNTCFNPNCVRHDQPNTPSKATQDELASLRASQQMGTRAELANVARLKDLAQSDFTKTSETIRGSQVLNELEDVAAGIWEKLTTFCGVTFVARGDVTVTKGAATYTGVFESTLSWSDSFKLVPQFLLTSPPFIGSPTPGLGLDPGFGYIPGLAQYVGAVEDLIDLALMCYGPDWDTVPISEPGSVKLALKA